MKIKEKSPDELRRAKGVTPVAGYVQIEIDRIRVDSDQPRKFFDDLLNLSESIKRHGQQQPITVRWSPLLGVYVIVCGERRYRAGQMAGITTMKCLIVSDGTTSHDEAGTLEAQIVENVQRQQMLPVETAQAIQRLMVLRNINATQAAEKLKIHKGTASKLVALLGMPKRVQELVDNGQLAASTAYEISKHPGTDEEITRFASRAANQLLSRSKVIEEVLAANEKVRVANAQSGGEPEMHEACKPVSQVKSDVKFGFHNGRLEVESADFYLQLANFTSQSPAAIATFLYHVADQVGQQSKLLVNVLRDSK